MNLVQDIVSLILNTGHASKQVSLLLQSTFTLSSLQTYGRMNKVFMCLSNKGTLDYLHALGEDYDVSVHKWWVNLEQNMIVQVHSILLTTKLKFISTLLFLLSSSQVVHHFIQFSLRDSNCSSTFGSSPVQS